MDVYTAVAPPKRVKFGPQRQIGIYVGCDSTNIIRFLDQETGALFTACFADCRFDEDLFPKLGSTDAYPTSTLDFSHLAGFDIRTNYPDSEIKVILNAQKLALELPDGFNNAAGVLKSKGLTQSGAWNAPEVTKIVQEVATDIAPKKLRGRPPGSLNKRPSVKKVRIVERPLGSTIAVMQNIPIY